MAANNKYFGRNHVLRLGAIGIVDIVNRCVSSASSLTLIGTRYEAREMRTAKEAEGQWVTLAPRYREWSSGIRRWPRSGGRSCYETRATALPATRLRSPEGVGSWSGLAPARQ